ncbi:MAG: hypothetical protein ACE5HX_19090 [bacterium]
MKRFLTFAGKVMVAHVISYFFVGLIAYQLFTKQFYEGISPLFSAFMRTPSEPELWRHAMIWFIPGQVLRGGLIAAVLYPFFGTLRSWNFMRRFLSIAGLYLVLGFWAATVAAPGTIDGMIYLRPEITLYAHLMVQPEIVIQGLVLAAWLALWMAPKPRSALDTQGD